MILHRNSTPLICPRRIVNHRLTFVDDFNCASVFQDLIRFYREVATREGEAFVAGLQRELAALVPPNVPSDNLLQVVLAENDQNRSRAFFRELAKLLSPT